METYSLFKKYARLLYPIRMHLLVCSFTGIFSVFLKMLLPLLSILIIDYAFAQKSILVFTLTSVAAVFLYFIDYFFIALNEYCTGLFKQKTSARISSSVFEKVLKVPNSVQQGWKPNDLKQHILESSSFASDMIINSLQTVPIELLKGVVFFAIYTFVDPMIALLATVSIPIYIYERRLFSGQIDASFGMKVTVRQKIIETLDEKLINLRTIKVFRREDHELDKFDELYKKDNSADERVQLLSLLSTFTNSSILFLWKSTILWYLGYKLIHGSISFGQFIALTFYLPMIEGPIRRLSIFYGEFRGGAFALKCLDQILSIPGEAASHEPQHVTPVISESPKGEVLFENIQMAYDASSQVLDLLSFSVPPGTSLAIVGESGAGKTTLFNLLLRFYNPNHGVIKIDGEDVQKINPADLRMNIGVVFQDSVLFATTIRENLMYANPEATESEMIETAKMAAAHEYIRHLPNGYDTLIEPMARNISGGLKQRIAIARALMHKPKILILDEATSALDAENEFLIKEALKRFHKKITVLMITHRLSMVKSFDQIAVIDKGSVTEKGTFPELMKKQGEFYKLYNLQYGGLEEFKRRFEVEFARSRRYEQELSLLMIEIQDYESHFEKYGTEIATRLVDDVEHFVKQNLRVMDFTAIFRINKIVVALPETSANGAAILGERMMGKIQSHIFTFDTISLKTSTSFGAVSVKESQVSYPEEIFDQAFDHLAKSRAA